MSSDDSFIVSPFTDAFQYIPDVPYKYASQVLGVLNKIPANKKRQNLRSRDFDFTSMTGEVCPEGMVEHAHDSLKSRSEPMTRGRQRRQTANLTPGYVTKGTSLRIYLVNDILMICFADDFGIDGDDTIHSTIPFYPQPDYLQANASFPTSGAKPETVDLIFLDFIASGVVSALRSLGASYTVADTSYYLPETFTTNSYLPAYAKIAWQANVPNCPVGAGVGSSN